MDPTQRYDGLDLWSPVSLAGLAPIIDALPTSTARAVDLGCGPATLLSQLLEAGRVARGVGLDHDPHALARARVVAARSAGRLNLVHADARALPLACRAFNVICSVGGPMLASTPQASLSRLAALVAEGGWFLHGDVVWQTTPPAAYLHELGDLPAASILPAQMRARLLEASGLERRAARDSTLGEWDAFEGRLLQNVEGLAATHPEDEALATRLAALRRWNAAQARWGRASMAFSLQVWRRPP